MSAFNPTPVEPQSQGQTIFEHLNELRNRLVKAAYAIAFFTIICWFFNAELFEIVRHPIAPFLQGGGLTFLHPVDKFMAHMKVAVLGGVILSCPIWLYQAWMFVSPGLYAHEKRYSVIFIFAGTVLFTIGVCFAYFLVLPTALDFLLHFGDKGAVISDKPMITIDYYLSFFMTMTLVFGAAFELPLVIVVLGAVGFVSAKFLRAKRRVALVVLAILSAIVTPPDVMSMLLLLVPLYVLYEISIILVAMIERRKAQAVPTTGE